MFNKILSILTFFVAIWGAGLSTLIFYQNKLDEEKVIYSSLTVEPKQSEPAAEGEKKDVRLSIVISNTGSEAAEVAPVLTVTVVNGKEKWQSELSARLSYENGGKVDSRNPTLLEPGESAVYNTSYSNFDEWFSAYNQYIVQLLSEQEMLVSYTPAPREADAISKSFAIEDGTMYRYFGKYEMPAARFQEVE